LAAALAAIVVLFQVVAMYRIMSPGWSAAAGHMAGWPVTTTMGGLITGAGCVLFIVLVVVAVTLLLSGNEVKHT
jgi:hypothetical protein